MEIFNFLSFELAVTVFLYLFLFSAVCWIVGAIGIFKISKQLGIKGSAVCFVPFLTPFCIARIAENKPTASGEKCVSAKIVLFLLVFEKVLAALLLFFTLFAKANLESAAKKAIELGGGMEITAFWSVIPIIVLLFMLMAVAIFYMINYLKSLWGAFSLLDKNRAVLWFVLSILFQNRFCNVIFFILRNKAENLEQQALFTIDETKN